MRAKSASNVHSAASASPPSWSAKYATSSRRSSSRAAMSASTVGSDGLGAGRARMTCRAGTVGACSVDSVSSSKALVRLYETALAAFERSPSESRTYCVSPRTPMKSQRSAVLRASADSP